MMRFNTKLLMIGSLLLASNAHAGGPGFDNIAVESGTTGDLSGCPTGATSCTPPAEEGSGFLQQEVRVGTPTYIQTVIIDPAAAQAVTNTDISTLAFSDITFIPMSGSAVGCPEEATGCTPPVEGDGFLQQEVIVGTTPYIQTVVIDPIPVPATSQESSIEVIWSGNNIIPHITTTNNTIISTGPFTAIDPILLNIPTEVITTGIDNFTPPIQSEKFGAFEPGRHLLTWQAPQEGSNAHQKWHFRLDVLPLATFGPAATISAKEGSHVKVPVYLNGKAPSYPVRIPYTVGGSASYPEDHNAVNGEVIINSGKIGTITFKINDDNITAEQLEEITFALQPPTTNNVALGLHTEKRVVITETHLAPQLDIAVVQRGLVTRAIDNHTESNESLQTTAVVIIRANNPEHKYRINWSESDNNLLAASTGVYGKSLRFNSANIPAGSYKIKAKITDLLSDDNKQYSVETLINISDITSPAISSSETPVQQSFIFDNGISLHWPALSPIGLFGYTTLYDMPTLTTSPLYPLTSFELIHFGDSLLIDSPFQSISRQVTPPTDVLTEQPITPRSPQVSSGLILKSGNIITASGKNGHQITLDDINAHGDINGGPALYPVDDDLVPEQIVDFEISGLTTPGQSVSIVIPQENPVPKNAVYRKYMPHAGWVVFTGNSRNALASANKSNGICPAPESSAYISGLTEGHDCIRLTIEDGGPNDADQQANSIIKDPGGVSSQATTIADTNSSDAGRNSADGGGGGSGFNLLWLLFALTVVRTYHYTKKTTR